MNPPLKVIPSYDLLSYPEMCKLKRLKKAKMDLIYNCDYLCRLVVRPLVKGGAVILLFSDF